MAVLALYLCSVFILIVGLEIRSISIRWFSIWKVVKVAARDYKYGCCSYILCCEGVSICCGGGSCKGISHSSTQNWLNESSSTHTSDTYWINPLAQKLNESSCRQTEWILWYIQSLNGWPLIKWILWHTIWLTEFSGTQTDWVHPLARKLIK